MPTFFWLEWPRATNGYRICEPLPDVFAAEVHAPPDEEALFLKPVDDEIVIYRPAEEAPALFMEFAHIEPTSAGVQQFANRHGLLWEKSKEQLEGELTIGNWLKRSRRMRAAVEMWEIDRKRGKIATVIKAISQVSWPRGGVYLQAIGDNPMMATFHLKADNLYELMWLQFVWATSQNAQVRRCAQCPSWFIFGPKTGRRESAVYCSTVCRRAAAKVKKESRK